MIVVDASAITEFLLQTDLGQRVEARLFQNYGDLHAPHLIDVEIVQALRRLVRAGDVRAERADEAIDDLGFSPSVAIRTSTSWDAPGHSGKI